MIPPPYAELHCLSNFTFLRGASHADELVERAHALGYSALAITDEGTLAGVVRAHIAAKAKGMKLIIGAEVRLREGLKLVLLACDRIGYGNLSELITHGRRVADKGTYALNTADLDHGLPGCLALLIPSALESKDNLRDVKWLGERFPDTCWIAAELFYGGNDRERLAELKALSALSGVPLVATGDVHMHARSRQPLQDTLTAIRLGKPVSACGHTLYPNAERSLRSRVQLAQSFPTTMLEETLRVAERCTFSLDELRYEYPDEIVPPGKSISQFLREEVDDGLRRRYPVGTPAAVQQQVQHELRLIAELKYEPYFLTVYDIVKFARQQNILCQGRGSAANSAVCFALGITEVDPARGNLLFERFISRERNEPPDIDVDFEHHRREEVIQYIYRKYGRDRAALAATVISYRPKSAIRDVGRALGYPLKQVDAFAKNLSWWESSKSLNERLTEVGLDPNDRKSRVYVALVEQLIGFPRHLSQHVGGFVIARDRLTRLVPVENASMVGRTVIQWDKDDLDALGLLKVDVLALGMLSVIHKALDYIAVRRGAPMSMQDIPAEDPGVYDMLCKADTIGVFQIESRAQMAMLPRLKPRTYYDLVIEIAMIRPGPIQGGMVHPYLQRRHGIAPIVYPSEEVKAVLKRTLGVPIFQEQVMALAIVAAGFTPGEADLLRRSMTSWRRKGGIAPMQKKLYDGMIARGYEPRFADQIQQSIEGFGEYGFPESHSASFAFLAYASAWLKCYEPAAFLTALLNSQPMGFYSPGQLIQDARRHGVEVRPVDVTVSLAECFLEDESAVRLGLQMVRGLSGAGADRTVQARQSANFTSVEDLGRRARLNRLDMAALGAAGALSPLAGHRRAAMWHVAGIESPSPLFADTPIIETPAPLSAPSESDEVVADYRALGFTLGRHPLALLRNQLRKAGSKSAAELADVGHGNSVRTSGIVTCRQRPGTASGVVFVTLEDETGQINVIVWRTLVERQRAELLRSTLLTVYGEVQREGDVQHVIAKRLIDNSAMLGQLHTPARNFH